MRGGGESSPELRHRSFVPCRSEFVLAQSLLFQQQSVLQMAGHIDRPGDFAPSPAPGTISLYSLLKPYRLQTRWIHQVAVETTSSFKSRGC